MNPAMHGRSFQDECFGTDRPESRTWFRTERSESSSGIPDTRKPAECRSRNENTDGSALSKSHELLLRVTSKDCLLANAGGN